MGDLKKEIKSWLKEKGKNRDWLAKRTYTDKRTIDRWMAVGGEIPLAKRDLILYLMKESREGDRAWQDTPANWKPFAVLFTQEEYLIIERAAKMDGMDVRAWCEKELIKTARYRVDRGGFLAAEDPDDEYKTGPR